MNYLAIDTSQKYLTVLAQKGEASKTIHLDNCSFKHSVTMLNAVEECLTATGMKLSEVDFIACVVGAGSFTGIRIGISTVKGLCAPTNIKALPLTSFDTLAYDNISGALLAVIDAKHDNFYVCGYDGGKITIQPCFMTRESLEKVKSGYTLISASPIEGLKTKIVDCANGLKNACISKCNQTCKADDLAPLYLRLSQAEEGRL